MPTDDQLRGKWERADEQLTILVGAAAADLIHQPPHIVGLSLAKLLSQRYDEQAILGYAAMAITRLGMQQKSRLDQAIAEQSGASE